METTTKTSRITFPSKAKGILYFIWTVLLSSSLASSARQQGSAVSDRMPINWMPDPFVEAAPLIVAVSCKNGAVVLAAHTFGSDEPLLYFSPQHELDEEKRKDPEDKVMPPSYNLPAVYKGPFRIHSVDRFGSVLACCGWRADCEVLVGQCRSLTHAELNQFGPPSRNDPSYGAMIANDLSSYLAHCAVADGVSPAEF